MKKFWVSLILFAVLSNTSALGQSDSLLTLIADLSEDESYYTDLLQDLQEQPIHINYAVKSDFMQLPLLNSNMVDSIITHREKYGPYTYLKELRSIIDPKIYDLLKPYLTTRDKGYHEIQMTQRGIYKTENNPQIEAGQYKGNALNSYSRLTYRYNPYINFGLITQKDPGEKNMSDHLNLFSQYKRKSWHIILGNYYLLFGQGLSHNNPYGSQKSVYLSAVFREPSSFARPNLSSSESSGKFGLFIEKKFNDVLSTFGFYSNSRRDAQLTDGILTGITYNGYHRTENELQKRKYFKERNWGAGFKVSPWDFLHISTIINQYNFNKAIQNNETVLGENALRRNYFNFSGDELRQAAISYVLKIQDLKLSAEFSSSNLGKPAWSQSVYFARDRFKIGLKYWQLDKDFQSIDGRAFDNGSPFPQGVKGYFAGIQFKLTNRATLSAYKKAEQKTWRSYFDPLPTAKSEWLTQWDYRINKTFFIFRYRKRINEDFTDGEKGVQRRTREKKGIRLQVNYKPLKSVSTRTRWEHIIVENPKEKGSLFFQDLNYHIYPFLLISSRYTFFKSASWDSRLYEYEQDLPGTFSNLALSGNGNKFYLLLKWHVSENLLLWFKWRYIAKNEVFKNGRYYKDLNRDISGQLQFKI